MKTLPVNVATRLALPLLLLLAALLGTYRLGAASLLGDEAIYGEVALSAVRFGELFPMRFGGSPITGAQQVPPVFALKPSILLPLETAAVKVFGNTAWAYRLPSALSLLVLIVAVWRITSPFGRFPAAVACLLLLGAPRLLVSHGFREAVLDGPLTAAFAFGLAVWWRPPALLLASSWRWHLALVVVCWLPLAIKFPVGLALPVIGWLGARCGVASEAVVALGTSRRTTRVALVAAVGLVAWAGWAYVAVGGDLEGLRRAQQQEVVARATAPDSGEASEGLDGYRDALEDDFGWWLLVLLAAPLALRRGDAVRPLIVSAFLWSMVVLLPFLLAYGKLPWYIYPAWPGLAIVVGAIVSGAAQYLEGHWATTAKLLVLALAVLGLRDSAEAVRNHNRVLAVDQLVAEVQESGATLYLPPETWRRGLDMWNLHALRRAPKVDWLGRAPTHGPCFWTLASDEQAMLAHLGVASAQRRLDLEPSERELIALEICGEILPHRSRPDLATLAPDSYPARRLQSQR